MKKLIAILLAIVMCAVITGCSGLGNKTTVTTYTGWTMGDESGYTVAEYVVVDGNYIKVSSHDYE